MRTAWTSTSACPARNLHENHTSRVSFTHETQSSGWIGFETPKNALGIRDANFLFSLWWVRHKPDRRGLLHPTLCLENSPRILKVPSTLNSGFFLFTPLIMNSLGLQKGERNQHRFFSDILWWNYWFKESSWKLIEFFFTQKWVSKFVFILYTSRNWTIWSKITGFMGV